MKQVFRAPWSRLLKATSLISTIALLCIAWLVPLPATSPPLAILLVRILPPLLLAGCALFTVRRYEVSGGTLGVQRLLWTTHIPLRTLTDAEWRPGPFGLAWRTCGNGGLFSFTGWYWQKSLGAFRALSTRTSDGVILRFGDRKPIVITPDDPPGMVEALNNHATLGARR